MGRGEQVEVSAGHQVRRSALRHVCHGRLYRFVQEALVPRHAASLNCSSSLLVGGEVEGRTRLHLRSYRVDGLQVALSCVAACEPSAAGTSTGALNWAGVLLARRHLAGLLETALRVLELLSLLLVRLLHLELKLLAVVVGDERGRDQPVRVQLRGREDHLVR